MSNDDWPISTLASETEALDAFIALDGKRWLCRGQSRHHKSGLVPSIDRDQRENLSRSEKLTLERRSIDLFRSTARFFTGPGEHGALTDEFVALMVLRHYGVPTRILDWTMSPYVAAFFAACDDHTEDGEIWAFDEPLYEFEGRKQWKDLPETTRGRTGHHDDFDAKLTAFALEEPHHWVCCGFYPLGFPRQNAQAGAYTITPGFNRNHASAIASLLKNPSRYHRYVIKADLKPTLCTILRERHGIWRGSLYPDSAGAANTAGTVFSQDGG